jgi:hypothetical protein
MIWATWRMHRPLFLASIAVAVAFAIWLAITGETEAHAWAIFTGHHCSVYNPRSSAVCMSSLSGVDDFSTVNAALCGALPPLLGLVLGVPLVAGEIQQRTNRLAWTQSITRTRWVLVKIGVGAAFVAAIVGAMAPLFWWWTDAAQRASHIQPANFDISGFAPVAYALFAFMLGAALGALIHRSGWAFAASVPIFALVRTGVRLYIRPDLIPPTAVTTDAYAPITNPDWWYLHAGSVPLGRMSPAPGQSWSSNDQLIANCQGPVSADQKALHTAAYCEKVNHLHYVLQFQPPSHFWALQAAESAIFLGLSGVLLGLTVLAVRRWRT